MNNSVPALLAAGAAESMKGEITKKKEDRL